MPDPDVYAVADRFKRALIARESAAVREIRRYYREAEGQITKRLEKLVGEIEQWRREHPGEDVPTWWLFERERLQSLQKQIEAELTRFAERATDRIEVEQQRLIARAEADAEALARAALGAPGVTVTWARLPKSALEQIVGHLQDGSPLRDLLDALRPAASEVIRKELVSGLALGQNPRVVARRCRDALNGNRVRAETIARTEMLRAYRESTRQSYLANSDVVKGWVWHAARDGRTCAMCWAMHGTKHTLDERLDDHPRGRCAMVPETKTWAELGFEGIPETRPEIETGESLFAKLPEEQQRQILGNAAFEAYKAGTVKLADFVGQKSDPRWGTMRYVRSLREILGGSEAKKWYTQPLSSRLRQQSRPLTPQERVLQMVRRVDGPLARRTGTVNNWNGTVHVQRLSPSALGAKGWDCSIIVSRDIIGNDAQLWPTINHEMLHALSVGLDRQAYVQFTGWEEGVVEKLQRLLGPRALKAIGEQPHVGLGAYDHYIAALEQLRTFLGRSESRFYLQLLRTPLADREQAVIAMGARLPASKQAQWQRLLVSVLPVLRLPR